MTGRRKPSGARTRTSAKTSGDRKKSVSSPIDQWRTIHELKRALAARHIDWDLSGHSVNFSPEVTITYEGETVSVDLSLEGGWTARFDVVGGEGRGISEDVFQDGGNVTYDMLLTALVNNGFRPELLTWQDIGLTPAAADELSVNPEGSVTSVDESSIEVTSPSGRVFTPDGPMDGGEPEDEEDTEALGDSSCEIAVVHDTDNYDEYSGELQVCIQSGDESLDGSFSFQADGAFYRCTDYALSDNGPHIDDITIRIADELGAVIREGRALLDKVDACDSGKGPGATF